MKKVLLEDVVKAIWALSGDLVIFFNKDTYHFLYIPKEYQKQIDYCSMNPQMLSFLTLQDIPFVEIREKFIETLSGHLKEEFQNAFTGQDRFLKWKRLLSKTHQWEEFRSFEYDKYKQLARIWCEQNQIPYR